MHYLQPDLAQSRNLIERAVKSSSMIVIFCNCEVSYHGRAVSELPSGDRVVIIKPDKTVLIHRPEGRNPVNWMGKDTSIKARINRVLDVMCESVNPREHMLIRVNKVHAFNSCSLIDSGSLRVVGSEADMARMIYENPHLISSDFKPLSLEEQTKYGFVDVLGHDNKGRLIVVECKRYKADLSAVTQLRRYVERIKKSKGSNNVSGIITAPSITKNALGMLTDWGFEFVRVEPPMFMQADKSKQKKLVEF